VTRQIRTGLKAAGTLAGVALARLGLPALAAAGVAMLVAAGLACWVLASAERTDRLAQLITASRAAGAAPAVPSSGSAPAPTALAGARWRCRLAARQRGAR
jgi:hypothetical protein